MTDGNGQTTPTGRGPNAEIAIPAGYAPEIGEIVGYWARITPPEGLPGRQHLDPSDIPNLLPHLWMTDVFRDPWRFRIRLVGTAIVNYAGRDSTGKWCTDQFPNFEQSDGYRDLVQCAGARKPIFRTAKQLAADGPRQSQRVHLPLATDGREVDIILSVTRYVFVPE
ncbi:MAG: PAS domain-containing protein [Thalassobaculaceae bacterium]|nr:PAS domain-containing protein [Thalassobaculaceae bacterium]